MASNLLISGLVFLLICFGLEDGAKGRNLSGEDDELESQLHLINKPSIKTIMNKYSDIIDCVDVYLQPAFDHPSLKNHTTQQELNSWKNECKNQSGSGVMYSLADLQSEQCPLGTIPIRRTKKDDLIRWKYFLSKYRSQSAEIAHPLDSTPGYHWAIMQSDEGKYHGASAWLNIAGLSHVESDQFSEAAISVMNGIYGPRQHFNFIKVGWMVNPMLYGDLQTRLTIFWKSGAVQCYNYQCPGFHQTSRNVELGAVLGDQGDDKFLAFGIYKENKTGNWWFTLVHRRSEEKVGYWPNSIFSSLNDHANYIQWGGTVYSPLSKRSPPMGNGRFASNGGARVINIGMVNQNGQTQLPSGKEILYADKPECYTISKLTNDRDAGWFFRFGGPGGCLG